MSIEIRNISKRFGQFQALNDVNLDIDSGELVALLGPSGCGKTTILRLIAGLEMASSGRILIGDDDVTRLPATARDVSMVFQSYALLPHMTVLQNVSYGLQMSGFSKEVVSAKAQDVLKQLGLGLLSARYPNELSGGQQQRVAVARALANRPKLVLADEPTGNLDRRNAREALQLIREVCRESGAALLLVSHDERVLAQFEQMQDFMMINRALATPPTVFPR